MSAADQYTRNEEAAKAMVARAPKVVTELLQHDNYAWAAHNCRLAAEAYFDLGLLHWRGGGDPRNDFRGAIMHYDNLTGLVRKHRLAAGDFDMSPVYAAMFLMGAKAPLVFFNEVSYETQRWPCYESRIVHALFDKEPGAGMAKLVESHAARNDELPERLLDAYLQLLGMRDSKADLTERVLRAKSAWAERKREELVERGPNWNGHGVMNDLYVDFYLAAILKKIGVKAQTVHTWNWD